MQENYQIDLTYWDYEEIMMLSGPCDKYLQLLRESFDSDVFILENALQIIGNEKTFKDISKIVKACFELIRSTKQLSETDFRYILKLVRQNPNIKIDFTNYEPVAKTVTGKLIFPKTIGQRLLVSAIEHNEIIFASGVAGTGKTYLAVMAAVSQLKKGNYSRIILTRPAVEAGESLGFLPGDLKEKVDPYLRPLYDALYDALGNETVEKLLEKDVIEVAPLAYMRGRTLDNAFIILDEAQNTTRSQMKMFLTRMGFNSKIVITGDISQIDLIRKKDSGLVHAKQILKDVDGIAFVELSSIDVVRNPMVQKIIECYERNEDSE